MDRQIGCEENAEEFTCESEVFRNRETGCGGERGAAGNPQKELEAGLRISASILSGEEIADKNEPDQRSAGVPDHGLAKSEAAYEGQETTRNQQIEENESCPILPNAVANPENWRDDG